MKLSHRTDEVALPPTITRIVAIGDPHGDLAGLAAVLAREERDDTLLVSVGDNVGYGDSVVSSELCRRLAAKKVLSVHGNHEAWLEPDGRLH